MSALWEPNPRAMGGRQVRRGGWYQAFIPAEIAARGFALDEDVVAAVASATKVLERLNTAEPRLTSLDALASALLRSESVASSRIEGVSISHKRLARAAHQDPDSRGKDSTGRPRSWGTWRR